MSTIMITGGCGFIGSYLARALVEDGDTVVAYDVQPPRPELLAVLGPAQGQVVYENGQITDLARLIEVAQRHRVEHVVDNAAFFDLQLARVQPALTYRVNIAAVVNVCEAARILGLGRVIQASTGSVIVAKRYDPIDERHPINDPTMGHSSAYGASKAAAEIVGLAYYEQGVDFLALRYSTVYGFGMRSPAHVKPIVEGAVRGRPVRIPTGADYASDFTYVRDQAEAVRLALRADSSRLSQRVYSVSGGAARTAGEAAAIVRELVPGAEVTVGAGLTEFEAKDRLKRGTLDTRNAEQDFGYRPRYDLRRGLAEYVALLQAYDAGNLVELEAILRRIGNEVPRPIGNKP